MISVGSEVQVLPGPCPANGRAWRRSLETGPATGRSPASDRGGVAQLGERLLCKQGVVGSNPIASIRQGGRGSPRPGRPAAKRSARQGGCWIKDPAARAPGANSETPHGSNRARAKPRRLDRRARRGRDGGAVIFHRVTRIWHVDAARKCEAGMPLLG